MEAGGVVDCCVGDVGLILEGTGRHRGVCVDRGTLCCGIRASGDAVAPTLRKIKARIRCTTQVLGWRRPIIRSWEVLA